MGKTKDRVVGLEYTIEALEDELEHLQEEVERWQKIAAEKQARISELITENDRLTLTYEPYTPPAGDETLPKYFGVVSFDFWPLRDWFRLSLDKWNPGRAFRFCVGPIRWEWAEN